MSTTDNTNTDESEIPEQQREEQRQQEQQWREQQQKQVTKAKQQGKIIFWTRGGETVDYIAWQIFQETKEITESIYEENQGLANFGAYLPENIPVIIPNVDLPETSTDQVILWQ